ncbi:histidine kinase [Noviherbaspirillum denitrificans]|uniref:Histidine kinase n=2 Tax=Noviherbaspirillum denitrificans TaxID=1968433 RepID=A0A254T685_9BURK|nr:histidine kinase [Noviherbaspirillum denitrificans]
MFAFGLAAGAFVVPSFAEERATAEEAVALVKKAVRYIKENGREKAFADFNHPAGQFRDRDLYIFVLDFEGKVLAQGANPRMVGKNILDLRDVDGKYFVKSYLGIAREKSHGWEEFKWLNPSNAAIETKRAYVERYDDVVVGSGIYKAAK